MSELRQIDEAAERTGVSLSELTQSLDEYSQRISSASQDEDQ